MIDPHSLLGPLILGIVEGLTEFIPVSSTGHLILAQKVIGYEGPASDVLDVVIQVGAILAICWVYRTRLWHVLVTLPSDAASLRFAINVLIASCLPPQSGRSRMISSSVRYSRPSWWESA